MYMMKVINLALVVIVNANLYKDQPTSVLRNFLISLVLILRSVRTLLYNDYQVISKGG